MLQSWWDKVIDERLSGGGVEEEEEEEEELFLPCTTEKEASATSILENRILHGVARPTCTILASTSVSGSQRCYCDLMTQRCYLEQAF